MTADITAHLRYLHHAVLELQEQINQIQQYLEEAGPPGPVTIIVEPIYQKEEVHDGTERQMGNLAI